MATKRSTARLELQFVIPQNKIQGRRTAGCTRLVKLQVEITFVLLNHAKSLTKHVLETRIRRGMVGSQPQRLKSRCAIEKTL
jgi:hypothetical protein